MLAFRLTPGIQRSAYDKYISIGNNDDDDDLVKSRVPCGCKTTDGRLFCDRHYRSRLLDMWDRLGIEKVTKTTTMMMMMVVAVVVVVVMVVVAVAVVVVMMIMIISH